ncbi:MAG: Hdr-like menaquinol oxidoreductase cytochrome c subunit [Gammaproteobacteria bacterium]
MLALLLLALPGASPGAAVVFPALPRGIGESCVEPLEVMRKNHMKLLNHQRDRTVHDGIRTTRHSLTGCVQCHAQQDARGRFIAVDAPGQFCEACHAFTGARPDCFECHAATPAARRAMQ